MPDNVKKNDAAHHSGSTSPGKTLVSGPLLDRLIKEKMARTPGCDGVSALPVVRVRDAPRRANWTVPGFVGDLGRAPACEAAIREYVDFLATQFDLADDAT